MGGLREKVDLSLQIIIRWPNVEIRVDQSVGLARLFLKLKLVDGLVRIHPQQRLHEELGRAMPCRH